MDENEKIELEVRRILSERQDNFQSFLEKSVKHFIWLITSITIVVIGLLYYFFGNTSDKLEEKISKGVDRVSFTHRINDKLRDSIEVKIQELVTSEVGQIKSEFETMVTLAIEDQEQTINDTIKSIIQKRVPDIDAQIREIVNRYQNKKLKQIASQRVNKIDSSNSLPKGSIVAWYGKLEDIPSGWKICDGTNGSPNLTNSFIYGGTFSEMGTKGGYTQHNHELHLLLSPLEHNWKYASAKQHALLTNELTESHKKDNVRKTSVSSNLPPYIKLVYLYKL